GKILDKIIVDAYGFDLEFITNKKGLIYFPTEDRKTETGTLEQSESGDWRLTIAKNDIYDELHPFGRGLHSFDSKNYSLIRTDKKTYTLSNNTEEIKLKLSAAIYQAKETPNKLLAFLTGTRLISFYNQNLNTVKEIRDKKAIQNFAVGISSTAVWTKNLLNGYNAKGKLLWSYRALPKSKNSIIWIDSFEVYIWITANSSEKIVATINEQGEVLKSQSFNSELYFREINIFPDDAKFVAQTNSSIEIYEI